MASMARTLLLATGLSLLVAACGSSSVANRERPDEFAVGRQAPLVIPPDITLAPPRPGAPRPLPADTQQQALDALFGPGVRLPPRAAVEDRLLQQAGATRVDAAIRNTLNSQPGDGAHAVDKGVFLRELLDAPAGTRNPAVARVTIPGAEQPTP